MLRTILFDFKRLTEKKGWILFIILAPILLLIVFSAVVAPSFFSGGMEKFTVAVFNEDSNPLTASVIKGMVENEKNRGLISVQFVSDLEGGQKLLDGGAVALVVIPPAFQETLAHGEQSGVQLFLNPDKGLEAELIRDVMASGMDMINEAQNSVNALYSSLMSKGISQDQAQQSCSAISRQFFQDALNRNAAVDIQSELSPLDHLMPVEYYASALLCVFLFLGSINIAMINTSDVENGVISRYRGAGRGTVQFVSGRIVSGALVILLQAIPMILLILPFSISGILYTGSPVLILPSLILFALTVSSGGVMAGFLLHNVQTAIKSVFLAILVLSVLGGALVPVSGLGIFAQIAPYTPLNAAMRMVASALFFFRGEVDFVQASLVCLLFVLLFSSIAYFHVKRRA